jgi:TP901 family phage tail tape measure protein
MEELTAKARELGATTQFSASQAAEGMSFLSMAGFEVNETLGSMEAMLNLAASAQLDLGTSADIVSNIMQGFALETEDAGRASDVLTKAFTSANTDLIQLGEAMQYVAPVAQGFGYSLEETAAAVGILSNAGIQSSMAGTSLRQVMIQLTKESDELGITMKDSEGNLLSFAEIIGQLEEKGFTAEEAMDKLGARAGPALQVLLTTGSDSLRDFTKELENAGGTAKEIAEKQMNTFNGRMKEFKSVAEEAAIILGNTFIPVITDLIKKVKDGLQWFSELNEGTQKTIGIFMGIAAAIGPVLIGLSSITKAIITLNTAALWGPLGIIAGTTALVIGLSKLKKHIDGKHVERLREEFGDLAEEISGTEKVTDDFLKKIEAIEQALRSNIYVSFEGVTTQVEQLAKNLGVSELQVIEIGLASDNVSSAMKEQLGVLKGQAEQEEAMRQYRLGQIAASKATLEIIKETQEKQNEITKEMKAQDRLAKAYKTKWEEVNAQWEGIGENIQFQSDILNRIATTNKLTKEQKIEELNALEEELTLNAAMLEQAEKFPVTDAARKNLLQEILDLKNEILSADSTGNEIINVDVLREANDALVDQFEIIDKNAAAQRALGNEFDITAARSQAVNDVLRDMINNMDVSQEDVERYIELYGHLIDSQNESYESQSKLGEIIHKTFGMGKEDADVFAESLKGMGKQLQSIAERGFVDAFESIGAALAKGENAADSFGNAIGRMLWEIVKALPMMFLQAGLQAMIMGNWPLGLILLAMSAGTALTVGATEARVEGLTENAKGNAFDSSSNIIPFAAGGIIDKPTIFPFASGTGLMGEAGPEAILPLSRDSEGNLGVKSEGFGTTVNVNIINYSGEEVQQREKDNGFGSKEIEIVIGKIQQKKIQDGSMDHAFQSRYGLKPRGKAV